MYNPASPTFSLDNFAGPLELLLYLIQKDEIDVCTIEIKKLTAQFIESMRSTLEVETNCETLSLAATLLLLKSQKLLPGEEGSEAMEEDPRIAMIQTLIEYCHFRDTAKMLSLKEEEQKGYFPRATPPLNKELGPGLEEVGIEDLKSLFIDMVNRSKGALPQTIHEEEWQVTHKLMWLRQILSHELHVLFTSLFSETKCRMELIVLFLALLEMMKHQEAKVIRKDQDLYVTRS